MTDKPSEITDEGAELDHFLQRMRPSSKANWLMAVGVTLVGISLFIAFATFAILAVNHSQDTRSRNRSNETLSASVKELSAQLEIQTDTTACVQLFAIKRDDAVSARDDAFSQAIIVAIAKADVSEATKAYQTAVEAAAKAKAAYNAYIANPLLPCPLTPGK